jgi:catechol 2,3-dioxygenase-like lactoylglutathione lyase family enzyme
VAEVALYVEDLERATKFYTEVLGLPLTAALGEARFLQTGPNSTLILFTIEGIENRVGFGDGATDEVSSRTVEKFNVWRIR